MTNNLLQVVAVAALAATVLFVVIVVYANSVPEDLDNAGVKKRRSIERTSKKERT